MFPDKDDDLKKYKGEHAQLMISSSLLQDIAGELNLDYGIFLYAHKTLSCS